MGDDPPSTRPARRDDVAPEARARDGSPLRLTVVEPLGTGGMIHYAYALCTALAARGVCVTLVTSSDYELRSLPHSFRVEERLRLWPHHDSTRSGGVPSGLAGVLLRARRAARRMARGARLVRAWFALLPALDARSADVVQFGTLRFSFERLFLRVLARRGLVLADICHEPEPRERRGTASRLVARVAGGAYASFDAVFVHGEYNRELFCRLYPDVADRTFPIQHGDERIFEELERGGKNVEPVLRARYGLSDGERAVVFFGHLVPSKGVDVLVRAHALAHPSTGVPLVVAGYPSKLFDVAALEALVRDLGVEDSVVLDLRYVPGEEVGALMRVAALVALPYRSASQSGAIQVAYAFGRPVVVTSVGGLPEVVDEGRSGLVVAPEAPAALADAIESILSVPGRAEEMGAHALALSRERFTWDEPAAQIERVYDSLLARRSS